MANPAATMKVGMTMDNSDLKKKSRESKEALRDFKKTGTDAVNKLGDAIGLNTRKFGQISNAVEGLAQKLQLTGDKGAKAFGKMLSGISGVTTGIAGIGLAGALATLKLLSEEAENFKTTLAGANIDTATAAYVDTYKQVVHDFNRELAQGFAETESQWKKFWGTAGATIKAYVTSGAIVSALSPQTEGFGDGLSKFQDVQKKANVAAQEAERISNEIYKVQRQISDSSVEWYDTEAKIAEYKKIAYNTTVDTVERQKALAEAQRLIQERYEAEVSLRKQLADLQFEYNDLAESSIADIDKANQLRIQENSVAKSMNDNLRELMEKQKTLTELAQKEAAAREASEAAAAKMAQSRADLKAWTEGSAVSKIETPTTVSRQTDAPGIIIPVTPVIDTSVMVASAEELNSMLSGVASSMSESLGALFGDLMTGGDAWENFSNSAISSLADLAISFGKICIAAGIASEGIKEALKLHPAAAIAGGAALVALGMAVKAGLSNISAGNYSSSSSVASATGSYGSSSSSFGTGFEMREMTVKVTGTLRADGNQLLTVIENENKRKNHTT